jgi:hypothetical protein
VPSFALHAHAILFIQLKKEESTEAYITTHFIIFPHKKSAIMPVMPTRVFSFSAKTAVKNLFVIFEVGFSKYGT